MCIRSPWIGFQARRTLVPLVVLDIQTWVKGKLNSLLWEALTIPLRQVLAVAAQTQEPLSAHFLTNQIQKHTMEAPCSMIRLYVDIVCGWQATTAAGRDVARSASSYSVATAFGK